jgi:ABC-type transport system involved in multi-copper enzyme maturation permease subunit
MSAIQTIATIARYEAKLLFRSWGFRIFSGIALLILTLIMVFVNLPFYSAFYPSRALAGFLPLLAVKLYNVFQGIIAVFLATEFLKRDRKQDTSQVILTHSFANGQYILGKFLGVFSVFALMNAAVLLVTLIIHLFFSHTIFAWQPYFLYFIFISLPTLIFIIGLSFFLGSLIRSQALVFLLALSYAFLALVIIGPRLFFVFDSFAFYQPIMYSDFIGLGNLTELLFLRGAYLSLGLGLIFGSVLLIKRLSQSAWSNTVSGILAVLFAVFSAVLGYIYFHENSSGLAFRETLIEESRNNPDLPFMTLASCDIRLKHEGKTISASADLTLINTTAAPIKTILLSLNPGLKIIEARDESGPLPYERKHHLLRVEAAESIAPGGQTRLSLTYSGTIDERFCYLDIANQRFLTPLRLWVAAVPRRYAVVRPNFVHLSPECGWYPRPGLPEALLYPSALKQDYSRYTLSVETPQGLTAISQGRAKVENSNNARKTFTFEPEALLPQISLTMGKYEQKSLAVDGIDYSLYLLNGHDRFTPNFKEIAADLPQLIRQAKDEYEVLLGLNYPYKQFSLVEVPIQITGFHRLWTTAQEMIQPQVVFLPEMGALSEAIDFRAVRRQLGRFQGRMSREISPKDIQRNFFNRFIRANLTATQPTLLSFLRPGLLGIRFQSNSETNSHIFPNFFTYTTHFSGTEWPFLGYALESYLSERLAQQPAMALRLGGGMSEQEKINKILQDSSLADILQQPAEDPLQLLSILEAKGKHLLALIQARLGISDFDSRLIEFLRSKRFQPISQKELTAFIAALGRLDLAGTIRAWYLEKGLPGFLFDEVQIFQVTQGERNKTQIMFRVTNSTDIEGVVKVNFLTRGRFRGPQMGGGPAQAEEARHILVPARTIKDVGIVLDQPPVLFSIDTSVSRNLPAVIMLPFAGQRPNPGLAPFDGESASPYVPAAADAGGEYIVDNEDSGFKLPDSGRENWLRRILRKILARSPSEEEYASGMNFRNPPDNWQPIITQNFYGRFIRSAFLKKSGEGLSKVSWTANLKEPGSYDIYFYHDGLGGGRRAMPPMRPNQEQPRIRSGKKRFLVHHEDGVEDVVVDLKDSQPGWNLIGTFRLVAGENRVELTDKNEERFVTADAVKWVKQK